MKRRKKTFIILAVILVVVLLVAGYIKFFNGRLIYFTTGMKSGELIKTAGQKTTNTCEADILMSDVKKEYEEMFGSNIWREKIGDADFESYIKDQIKSKLMRVKAMNVKAKERGVVLGREEKDSVGKPVLIKFIYRSGLLLPVQTQRWQDTERSRQCRNGHYGVDIPFHHQKEWNYTETHNSQALL